MLAENKTFLREQNSQNVKEKENALLFYFLFAALSPLSLFSKSADMADPNAGDRRQTSTFKNKNLFNGGTCSSNNADGPGSANLTHGGELVQNANYTNGQTTQATIFLSNNNNSSNTGNHYYNNSNSHGRKNAPNSQQNQQNACVYTTSNSNNNNLEHNFSNLHFYAQQPAAHYDVCHQQVCVCVCVRIECGSVREPQANFTMMKFQETPDHSKIDCRESNSKIKFP